MNESLKNILISGLIGLSFGLILFVGILFFKNRQNYYAVFLNNGSVYFGKLSFFPRLKLDEVLYPFVDQNGQTFIGKFKELPWGPKGEIYLNKNSVLFIAPIKSNSSLINIINSNVPPVNQQQLPPNQLPTNPVIPQNSTSSSY